MKISARVDYGLQAILEIAAADRDLQRIKADEISEKHGIPMKFLESILSDLKKADLIEGHRGSAGGYNLRKPSEEIAIADVVRAIDGPLASVHGLAPERATYKGEVAGLTKVWIATRVALREVLEEMSLADILDDDLPTPIAKKLSNKKAWRRRA
ncbi:MAG: RrF2 family transcriptional regulator [Actinomycetota bacterium]